MNTLTTEQAIYARVVTEAHVHFSEVVALTCSWRLRPRFKGQYAALGLRLAISAFAFAAIAPNKKAYESLRGIEKLGTDWHAKRIFKNLGDVNHDFFPKAVTGPSRTADGKWHFDRPVAETFPREVAEEAYDRCSAWLHAANPWGDEDADIDLGWLAGIARKGLSLLQQHVAFIRTHDFTGCWIASRQPSGDWRFLTASAEGDFIVEPAPCYGDG
jgi:hypothetical protein